MKKYTVEKRKIPSTGRDIKILIFRPTAAKKEPAQTPGVLWIHGGGDFYVGWMKDPRSAMISCNDGFRPVSFLIEALDEDAE